MHQFCIRSRQSTANVVPNPTPAPTAADHNIPPAPAVTVIRPKILGLILDVKTRWNTSYSMLQRFEDLRPAVEMFISSDPKLHQHRLSEEEWLCLTDVVSLLKPIYQAKVALSKSKYTSLSLTVPIYVGLIKVIDVA
jgi:hypothetical protein